MKLNPTRTIVVIVFASLVVGGGAVYMSKSYIEGRIAGMRAKMESQYEKVPVIVARQALEAGTRLTKPQLKLEYVPKRYASPGSITPAQWSAIQNEPLRINVAANQPILREYVGAQGIVGNFSGQIASGLRALTFPVDLVSSVGGLLNPGDVIDLVATIRSERDGEPVTLPFMDAVEILAVGEVYQGVNNRRYQHITLEVTPKNAARILQIQQAGSLMAILRSPRDDDPGLQVAMTTEDLFASGPFAKYFNKPEPPAKKPVPAAPRVPRELFRPVEVIIGGAGR